MATIDTTFALASPTMAGASTDVAPQLPPSPIQKEDLTIPFPEFENTPLDLTGTKAPETKEDVTTPPPAEEVAVTSPEPESKPEEEVETKDKQPESEQPEPEQPEPKSESKPESKPKVEPAPEAEAKPEPKSEPEPEPATASSTLIFIGAAGSIGSHAILSLARHAMATQPTSPFYHLILTSRTLENSPRVESLKNSLATMNYPPNLITWLPLDLTTFESVRKFAKDIRRMVAAKEIPTLKVLINSAARIEFLGGEKTEDGFEPTLEINTLSPLLLISQLLEPASEESGAGFSKEDESVIIWIGSRSQRIGEVCYFDGNNFSKAEESKKGKTLGLWRGLKKYGSSKLLAKLGLEEMQKRLESAGYNLKLVTYDPGSTNSSNASQHAPSSLSVFESTLNVFGPIARTCFRQPLQNPPRIPAEGLINVLEMAIKGDREVKGKWFGVGAGSKGRVKELKSKQPKQAANAWPILCRYVGKDLFGYEEPKAEEKQATKQEESSPEGDVAAKEETVPAEGANTEEKELPAPPPIEKEKDAEPAKTEEPSKSDAVADKVEASAETEEKKEVKEPNTEKEDKEDAKVEKPTEN